MARLMHSLRVRAKGGTVLFSWRRSVVLVALLTSVAGCGSPPDPPAPTPSAAPAQASPTPAAMTPVQIEMKNVHLHLAAGIVLKVRQLRGEMVSKVAGTGPVFDNQRSYVLRVFSGDATMD